jgi:hypothetical protein
MPPCLQPPLPRTSALVAEELHRSSPVHATRPRSHAVEAWSPMTASTGSYSVARRLKEEVTLQYRPIKSKDSEIKCHRLPFSIQSSLGRVTYMLGFVKIRLGFLRPPSLLYPLPPPPKGFTEKKVCIVPGECLCLCSPSSIYRVYGVDGCTMHSHLPLFNPI